MSYFFNKPYNRDEFLSFLRNEFLPDSFQSKFAELNLDKSTEKIKEVQKIGEVPELENLQVYEIRHNSENDPRVTLTRETFSLMKDYNIDYALAVYVSENSENYRFSFVYSDLKLENKQVKKVFSNPRRFSFYLGPDAKAKTPTMFLKEKGRISNLEDLKERFDVNVLTKRFYKEISNWYFWALKNVEFPKDAEKEDNGRNIALIRLITRFIFVWFMREMDLVPDYLFKEENLDSILKDLDDERSTYYKAILQNLFFVVLSNRKEDRKFRKPETYNKGYNEDFMNHEVFRYQEYFDDPDKILEFFNDIPFLNGGIFECLDRSIEKNGERYDVRIDGFSRTKKHQPKVPNYLFFTEEKKVDLSEEYNLESKNEEEVRGLIKILEDYNFTVDENTPIDQEVSLDPELLGKIFENLLASYNPETSTTARKATGSYYTPREVVEYMVDESLENYFKDKLKEEGFGKSLDKRLSSLLSYKKAKSEFNEKEEEILIREINNLKVIDPAVGSGAFPMGILQKLTLILSKIDPNNQKWKEVQIEAVEDVPDYQVRQELIEKIEKDFEKGKFNDYGRKMYLIQKCIYGVDIQPIAIEIAKLRFLISLLVDEKVDKKEDNKGVTPLPNLEVKLVAANSLLKIQRENETEGTMSMIEMEKGRKIKKLKRKIQKIRKDYFHTPILSEKKKLRKKDRKLRKELQEAMEQADFKSDDYLENIKDWDPYSHNSVADFFDPEWMFGFNNFDIVIGNPPYIQLQNKEKISQEMQEEYKKQNYQTFRKTGDIYCLFYERGWELLDEGGVLTYITSNKWMRAKYGKSLREFISKKTNPITLLNLGPDVFENVTVDTNILIFKKEKNKGKTKAIKATKADLQSELENAVDINFDHSKSWYIGSPKETKLKEKIEKKGTPLKDWNIEIYRGVLTGYNKAFIIDEKKKEELIKKDPKSKEIIKPILRGRDIKRYSYDFANKYVIATFPARNLDIDKYPTVKKHLLNYGKNRLAQEGKRLPDGGKSRKKTSNKWFETQDQIAYYEEFEKEKIVWAETADKLKLAFVDSRVYLKKTCFLITGDNLNYLCGLLNSKTLNYYIRKEVSNLGKKGMSLTKSKVKKTPIPPINNDNYYLIEQIKKKVNKIKENKKKRLETEKLEQEVNELVYNLYNLTSEEIEIIEKEFKN